MNSHPLLRGVLNALLILAGLASQAHLAAQAPAPAPNRIQQENAKSGSTDWQLTRVRMDRSDGSRAPAIEGYCSRQSVAAGETLEIMVSTNPPEKFQIEIFRTGYYDGRGARLMTTLGPFQGNPQPVPTPNERTLHECRWQASAELTIPEDWLSGVYLGRLTTLVPEDDRA